MKFCSYFYVAVTIFILIFKRQNSFCGSVCLVCADLYALFMLLASLYKANKIFDQITTNSRETRERHLTLNI